MTVDSDGNPPQFLPGDEVVFCPTGQKLTVVRQVLHHDCGETFWGHLVLTDVNGLEIIVDCWQCQRVEHD